MLNSVVHYTEKQQSNAQALEAMEKDIQQKFSKELEHTSKSIIEKTGGWTREVVYLILYV
jgi:hypothetical protein